MKKHTALRDVAGSKQQQTEQVTQYQAVIEIRAERKRVDHQRHAGHQQDQKGQQAEKFAEHDMPNR